MVPSWLGLAYVGAILGAQVPSPSSESLPREHTVKTESRSFTGTVEDAEGRPLKGARISVVPIGLPDLSGAKFDSVTSGPNGQFDISATTGGQVALTVTSEGHEAARVQIDGKPVRIQLRRGGSKLSGRVLDRWGRPQAHAEVRLALGLGGSGDIFLVKADGAGHWSASIPEGDYLVHAVTPGHESTARVLGNGNSSADLIVELRSLPVHAPRAVTDWLKSSVIPLGSSEPNSGMTDLAPVGRMVGDARVVGLGEVTHGTREIFRLKHRLVEYLVAELGFTVFAIEFGLAESIAIDDYVLGRGGNTAQLLADQSVAVWRAEELLDLIRWVKDWNQTHERKVRFHGLDMRLGGRAAQELFDYLRIIDRAALSLPAAKAIEPLASNATYRDAVRRPPAEMKLLAAQARELSKLLDDRKTEYIAQSTDDDWWRASAQARALVQMLEWRAAANPLAKVQVREQALADNAMHLLDRYGPDSKAIVWAHNAHVAGDANAEPRMSGVHLRRRLGTNYRAFATSLYRGSYQAADESGKLREYDVPPGPPGSIEQAIATLDHPVAALDLRAIPASGPVKDWFEEFRVMRQYDGLFDDQRPAGWDVPAQLVIRNYDALFFVKFGTPAR